MAVQAVSSGTPPPGGSPNGVSIPIGGLTSAQFWTYMEGWGIASRDNQDALPARYRPVGNWEEMSYPERQKEFGRIVAQAALDQGRTLNEGPGLWGYTAPPEDAVPETTPTAETETGQSEAEIITDFREAFIPFLQDMGFNQDQVNSFTPLIEQWATDPRAEDEDWIMSQILQTDAYQQRFGDLQDRYSSAFPQFKTPTASEILQMESEYLAILSSAGLPQGFYDSPEDAWDFIVKGTSPAELALRVQEGYDAVSTVSRQFPEIRNFFGEIYGDSSDQALATFFLDPDKSQEMILQDIDAIFIGGRATQFGMDFDEDRAYELAAMGFGDAAAVQSFGQVASFAPLFAETFSERDDFTAEEEGVDTVLGIDTTTLRDRLDKREADMTRNSGAIITEEGIIGAS